MSRQHGQECCVSAGHALKQEHRAIGLRVRICYIGLGAVCSEKLSLEAVAANEAPAKYSVEAEEHTESHCDMPTSEELEDVAFL